MPSGAMFRGWRAANWKSFETIGLIKEEPAQSRIKIRLNLNRNVKKSS